MNVLFSIVSRETTMSCETQLSYGLECFAASSLPTQNRSSRCCRVKQCAHERMKVVDAILCKKATRDIIPLEQMSLVPFSGFSLPHTRAR